MTRSAFLHLLTAIFGWHPITARLHALRLYGPERVR